MNRMNQEHLTEVGQNPVKLSWATTHLKKFESKYMNSSTLPENITQQIESLKNELQDCQKSKALSQKNELKYRNTAVAKLRSN